METNTRHKASRFNDNDFNIYDLIKLSHIPEINHPLKLTLAGIEDGPLTESVKAYKKETDLLMEQLFTQELINQLRDPENIYPPLYWFELSAYRSDDWGLTLIDPSPPAHDPHFAIMPQDIIDHLSSYPVDREKVVALEAVFSKHTQKKMDIRFQRFSENHIAGTVRLNTGKYKETIKLYDSMDRESLLKDLELPFQLFLFYLYHFPWFRKEFIKYFLYKIEFTEEE
jgi:hypothetical protein